MKRWVGLGVIGDNLINHRPRNGKNEVCSVVVASKLHQVCQNPAENLRRGLLCSPPLDRSPQNINFAPESS
jgi:hypothetical protein